MKIIIDTFNKRYELEQADLDDFMTYVELRKRFDNESDEKRLKPTLYTLAEVETRFRAFYTTITDSTIENYLRQIKKLYLLLEIDALDIELLYDFELIFDKIRATTKKNTTIKLFLTTVIKVFSLFKLEPPKIYRETMTDLEERIQMKNEVYTDDEKQLLTYLDENVDGIEQRLINAYEENKSHDSLQSLVVFMVYARQPPLRRCWVNIKVDVDKEGGDVNSIDTGRLVLYMNDYKNVKVLGKYVYDLKLFEKPLKYISLLLEQRKKGDFLLQNTTGGGINPSNLSRWFTRVFGNKQVGVNILRKYYQNLSSDSKQVEEVALTNKLMGHSEATSRAYYLKHK